MAIVPGAAESNWLDTRQLATRSAVAVLS